MRCLQFLLMGGSFGCWSLVFLYCFKQGRAQCVIVGPRKATEDGARSVQWHECTKRSWNPIILDFSGHEKGFGFKF